MWSIVTDKMKLIHYHFEACGYTILKPNMLDLFSIATIWTWNWDNLHFLSINDW